VKKVHGSRNSCVTALLFAIISLRKGDITVSPDSLASVESQGSREIAVIIRTHYSRIAIWPAVKAVIESENRYPDPQQRPDHIRSSFHRIEYPRPMVKPNANSGLRREERRAQSRCQNSALHTIVKLLRRYESRDCDLPRYFSFVARTSGFASRPEIGVSHRRELVPAHLFALTDEVGDTCHSNLRPRGPRWCYIDRYRRCGRFQGSRFRETPCSGPFLGIHLVPDEHRQVQIAKRQ
jgi:hypothetical protein